MKRQNFVTYITEILIRLKSSKNVFNFKVRVATPELCYSDYLVEFTVKDKDKEYVEKIYITTNKITVGNKEIELNIDNIFRHKVKITDDESEELESIIQDLIEINENNIEDHLIALSKTHF